MLIASASEPEAMAAEAAVCLQNEPIQPGGCADLEAPGSPTTWIPTAPSNWRSSASAGVLGLALAGPAGGKSKSCKLQVQFT